MQLLDEFFALARRRHSVHLMRESGAPPPWTDDPVLQKYRFCNVFRELDRTTRWFRENVREPLRDDPKVIVATIGFRWFNRIETGERIKDVLLEEGWNRKRVLHALLGCQPLVTGAYVIKTPDGLDKLSGILDCMDNVVGETALLDLIRLSGSLAQAWKLLQRFPYLGSFMAYEVVTDLRHTRWLCDAGDKNLWAAAGPGCARGLGWVLEENPDLFSYSRRRDQEEMLRHMNILLGASREDRYWPAEWPAWEMREVEHTLCEFDKWCRAAYRGERLKRRYCHN